MTAEIDQAAAQWHMAQAKDEMDWVAFADWLEADPRHRDAYNAIALLDARIDAARPVLSQILADPPALVAGRWPRVAGWAIAVAALLLVAVVIAFVRRPNGPEAPALVYRAPNGHARDVRLADGSIATLAPGSVLRVEGKRSGALALEGTAFFAVRHDPARTLTVHAGIYEIRDIGTRFDVSADGDMIRVAVAEGRVGVRSTKAAGEVIVDAGRVLTSIGKGGPGEIKPARASSVGAWRRGPLVYDDVPLAMVAADISRTTGQSVMVQASASGRRFSGVIALGDRATMVATLCSLTQLQARTDGDAILLSYHAGR